MECVSPEGVARHDERSATWILLQVDGLTKGSIAHRPPRLEPEVPPPWAVVGKIDLDGVIFDQVAQGATEHSGLLKNRTVEPEPTHGRAGLSQNDGASAHSARTGFRLDTKMNGEPTC